MTRVGVPVEGAAGVGVAMSKFAVPRRRPDVVRRPRLNSLLDAAIGSKGSLIAAPAGYGKTTLVVDWLQTFDFASVWLSLDEWDANLPAFARSLASAVGARFDTEVPLGDERFWQPRTVGTVFVKEDLRRGWAGWPHYTAIIVENRSKQRYAVDGWKLASGEEPEIVEAEKWYVDDTDIALKAPL